jgi:acyl-coenzyme A synthetase/AMP-(fatty) acid ligase
MGGALEENRASIKDLVVRLFAGNLVAWGRPLILGGTHTDAGGDTAGTRSTLDALFRRAALRGVNAVALTDPPNRESFSSNPPRKLTFAEADRAISAFAAQLRRLGLQTDTVVALQLPNTVESVIALLGIIRAGMIAAPLPLLWRKRDIVNALRPLGAKMLVTSSRVGSVAHAEIAMQAAAELFPVRYVCAFGSDLPDGIVPLDDIFFSTVSIEAGQTPAREGDVADHVAVVTFEETANGIRAVARSQRQLIAGGLGPFQENGAVVNGKLLSAIPLGSFAGLSLTLMPWLLGGGTLSLHHAFDPEAFAAQAREHEGGTVVLPGPALRALTKANSQCRPASIMALWRTPDRLASESKWNATVKLIDVACFGETGLIAAARGDDHMPKPIPAGLIGTIAETIRSTSGTLMLRGPMVPSSAFPPGIEENGTQHFAVDDQGFADTGYPCRVENERIVLVSPPAGVTSIGGYRLHPASFDAAVAAIDTGATIVALPDAMLGQRLAGSSRDNEAFMTEMQVRGLNALIAGAFAPRTQAA